MKTEQIKNYEDSGYERCGCNSTNCHPETCTCYCHN